MAGRKFEFGKLDITFKGRITQNLFRKYVVDRQEKNSQTGYDMIKTTTKTLYYPTDAQIYNSYTQLELL